MTRLVRPDSDAVLRDHEERLRALERMAGKNLDAADSFAATDNTFAYVGAWTRVPFALTSDSGDPFVYDEANGIWTPNYAMTYNWALNGILYASSDLASPHVVVLYFTTGGDADPTPGGGFMGALSPCAMTGGVGPPNAWAISVAGSVSVNPSESLNLWTGATDSPGGPTFTADYTLAVNVRFQQA